MAVVPTLNDIKLITPILEEVLQLDIYNYALSFLRRRFAYVFNQLNVKSISGFIDDIKQGKLIDEFLYHFQVGDTEMFRDPSFWRTLKNKLLPKYENQNINIWLPDLVSSHELFSLLVVLQEDKLISSTNIICNSSSSKIINEVLEGFIPVKSLEVSKQNFKRLELNTSFEDYFICEDGKTTIDNSLLKNVQFIHNSFFIEGPSHFIDIVLYRNRMIYYNSKLQCKAEEEIFKYIKNSGGFIALGIKEQIGNNHMDMCESFDNNEQIYKV